MDWNEVKMPEVPAQYKWRIVERSGAEYEVTLIDRDSNDTYPFVLWVNGPRINIAPIGETQPTRYWFASNEKQLLDNLHVATTCVLLGQWEEA